MTVRPCEQAIIDREAARIRDWLDSELSPELLARFHDLMGFQSVRALVSAALLDVQQSDIPNRTALAWLQYMDKAS